MKRLVAAACLALAAFNGVGMSTHTSVLAANLGNSDAAHMYENGGYLTLQGSDGTTFKNAGQCTSFAAHGGTIGSIPACTVIMGTQGCVTLTNAAAPLIVDREGDLDPSQTITLTGVFSFSPTSCTSAINGQCPPGQATSGGTYTIAGSNARTRTFTVSGTQISAFINSNSEVDCSMAAYQAVTAVVTFTGSTNTTTMGTVRVQQSSAGNGTDYDVEFGPAVYVQQPATSAVSITC